MQTTLLGLAIAFILALIAALVGPYFVDWNQFRPQFARQSRQIALGELAQVGGDADTIKQRRLRFLAHDGDLLLILRQ